MEINFVIIFILFLIVLIDGIDEDLFNDLWKNLKPSTSKNFKKQKFGEINAIKEEIIVKDEKYEQQNANKIEIEDTKPKELQKIKKEKTLEEQNNNLNRKLKLPKIEMEQLEEESYENEFNEEADQNVSSTDQSNSGNDEDYNNMNTEEINEMQIVNEFNLRNNELRKENVYNKRTNTQFECEIAKKFDTYPDTIYKLKKELGQKRVKTEESEETKMELIRKFDKMRKEKICGFNYDNNKRSVIECEIAKELGINRKKIYQWKKEFGVIKGFSNQQKQEKIEQFEKVKKEFIKKFNLKTTKKIYEKIANKVGVKYSTIYKLKKKLGQKRVKTDESDETKMDLIRKFDKMRKEKKFGLKYDKKKRSAIECEIANELGINRHKIYQWKKEFGVIKGFSNQQKQEKIEQFEKLKEEFTKKFNLKVTKKIETKIAIKLGVVLETICRWKRKFGFSIRKSKIYSDAEKLEYVKRSEEIRKSNSMMSETKISEELEIPRQNLSRWTKKLGTKSIH